MVHENITTAWVYEHYLAYLYLSIADSGKIIALKDLEGIKNKAFKALDEERSSFIINEVYREYRLHTEEEKRNYIKGNVSRFLRTDSIKQRVICDLEANINKDDESEEQVMFRFIRKVINNSK